MKKMKSWKDQIGVLCSAWKIRVLLHMVLAKLHMHWEHGM